MGKVVMGIGMSHSPLLALDGERWDERANDDRQNQRLNTIDGRFVPYGEIADAVKDRYADIAITEKFIEQDAAAQRALDRLGDDLAKVAPDVVVIIGDDHYELFSSANMPAISIYHGEQTSPIRGRSRKPAIGATPSPSNTRWITFTDTRRTRNSASS